MSIDSRYSWNQREEREDNSQFDSYWILSYLDTFTLLLAFFVIFTIITGQEIDLTDDTKNRLRSFETGMEAIIYPINDLLIDLNLMLQEDKKKSKVEFIYNEYELRLQFRGSSFFRSGEADLLPQGREIIEKIVSVTNRLKHYEFKIDVEGHADNRPINSQIYPSNWELSAARAANIVKSFIDSDFEPKSLKASGYGDSYPLKPNEDVLGNPIPENLDLNRRVVIRLYF